MEKNSCFHLYSEVAKRVGMQSNLAIYLMYKYLYFRVVTQTESISNVPARTRATSSSAYLTMSAAMPTPIPRHCAKSL